jgi:hypothetical protein
MSKETSLIVLGLVVATAPYLGVPNSWRTILIVLCGLAIALVGFFLRAEALKREGKRSSHHPFVENMPDDFEDEWSIPDRHHDRTEGLTSLN